jgi:hypothetical protein
MKGYARYARTAAIKSRSSSSIAIRCAVVQWNKAITGAIGYPKHFSRSHDAVIRVCDDAGNVIETLDHKGDFKEP